MKVAVAFSPQAGVAIELSVELPSVATAIDAVRASGLGKRMPDLDIGESMLGIWGRACLPDTRLHDGDRVEVYRSLTMDPNEARRLRAKQLRTRKRA